MRYWEDFHVGDEAVHGSHEITEEEILAFAHEYDPQPIHVDAAAAAAGPFGGLIASGWQTASIYMGLYVRAFMLDTAGMGSPVSRSCAGSRRCGPATSSPHGAGSSTCGRPRTTPAAGRSSARTSW